VEGEQVILSLQCARFLIKAVAEVETAAAEGRAADELAETVRYLAGPITLSAVEVGTMLSTAAGLGQLLGMRARMLARRLARQLGAAVAAGQTFDAALNRQAVLACRASDAHVAHVTRLLTRISLKGFESLTVLCTPRVIARSV
jgi:hypothetical protein